MLDILFTLGQAASALLLIYGAYLVLIPAATQDGVPLLGNLRTEA